MMRCMRFLSRAVLIALLPLAAVSVSRATLPHGDAPRATSLVGQLLVASPDIGDPRFVHSVILVVRQSRDGALGIVINRPLGDESVAKLLKATGQDEAGVSGRVRVLAGGPVDSSVGFIVHSAEYHRPQTLEIDRHVAVTSSPEVLRDIGHNAGPRKCFVAFGYAGWGPGQLENELAEHVWFTIPDDPKLVFEEDREKVWDDAKARETVPL